MLSTLELKSSVLKLKSSLIVLQLPTNPSNLSTNGY